MASPETRKFVSEDPQVFFSVGVLGSASLDFMSRVSERYDTEYFSFQDAQERVLDDMDNLNLEPKVEEVWDEVSDRLYYEAEGALKNGSDVVLDFYYHRRSDRREICDLAAKYGATTIGLVVTTPYAQCSERVRQWANEGKFTVPAERWPRQSPNRTLDFMKETVEWPKAELDQLDYAFRIKGTVGGIAMDRKLRSTLYNHDLVKTLA